jgi:hypothetical protein
MVRSNYWENVDAIKSKQFVRGHVLNQLLHMLSARTLLQSCKHYQVEWVTKLCLTEDGSEYMLLAWPQHRLYTNVIDSEHVLGPSTATTHWHMRSVVGSLTMTKYFALEPESPKPSNVWKHRDMWEWDHVGENGEGQDIPGFKKTLYAYSAFEVDQERETYVTGSAVRSLACIGPTAWTVREQRQLDGERLSPLTVRYTPERTLHHPSGLYEPFVNEADVRMHVKTWADALNLWQDKN